MRTTPAPTVVPMSTQTPSRAKSRSLHILHLNDGRVVQVDSPGTWPRMTLPAADTCQGMHTNGQYEAMYCGAPWAPGHTRGYCGSSTCEAARLLHECANAADGCPNHAVRRLNLCAICAGTDDKREHATRVGNKAQKGRNYVSTRDHYRQMLKNGNVFAVVAHVFDQEFDGRHKRESVALLTASASAIAVIAAAEMGAGTYVAAVAAVPLVVMAAWAAAAYAGRDLFQSARSGRVAAGTWLGARRQEKEEDAIWRSGPNIDKRAADARATAVRAHAKDEKRAAKRWAKTEKASQGAATPTAAVRTEAPLGQDQAPTGAEARTFMVGGVYDAAAEATWRATFQTIEQPEKTPGALAEERRLAAASTPPLQGRLEPGWLYRRRLATFESRRLHRI